MPEQSAAVRFDTASGAAPTIRVGVLGEPLTVSMPPEQLFELRADDVRDPCRPREHIDWANAGNRWVAVRLTLVHQGNQPVSVCPQFFARIIGDDGAEYGTDVAGVELEVPCFQIYEEQPLLPGDRRCSYVYAEVPEGVRPVLLQLSLDDPSLGAELARFSLDG